MLLQSVKKKYHGKTREMQGNWLLDVMEKLCREENGGCKRDHRSDNWAPPELEFCSNIWAVEKGWLFDRLAMYWLLHWCTESYLWLGDWFSWSAVGRCIYINIRISLCICACVCTSWTVLMYRCKNWGRWWMRPRKSWHRSVHKYQQGYKISTNSNNQVAHQFYEFCCWVGNEMKGFAPF